MLSNWTTSSRIPETNGVVKGRAGKGRSIWGEGEGAYGTSVTRPRVSDLLSRRGVPTVNRSVLCAEEPAAVA